MKWQNEQKGGMSDFQACSPTVTHTALRARSWIAFDALSLSFHKERAKEKEPGRSPGASLPSAVLTMNGGNFTLAKFLHLGRISARPRWGCG